MVKALRILLVEDSEDDLHLILRELTRRGYAPTYRQVYTETGLRAALEEGRWDAVVCDYALPGFRAEEALKAVQEADPDMPFIVVSGRIGEETAVAMMRAGAHDYLMKHNLRRLVPAIERELREADVRRRRRRVEEELRAANEAKDRFLATLSHELRNPLAAISASIDALWLRVAHDPSLKRALEVLKRNVDIQARLVNDLLDLSRISLGKVTVERQPMRLDAVLQAAMAEYKEVVERAGLTLKAGRWKPVWTDGDADRLRQVFGNLLDNAIKFTPAGGTITVTMEHQDGWIRVSVADTGAGLAPSQLDSVFDLFSQGNPARAGGPHESTAVAKGEPARSAAPQGPVPARSALAQGPVPARSAPAQGPVPACSTPAQGPVPASGASPQGPVPAGRRTDARGLGVGLALVKQLVELHGGRVWAESPGPGRGSRFTVELAACPAPSLPRTAAPRHPAAGLADVRIMMIDDNLDLLAVVSEVLELEGCHVTAMGTAEEALIHLTEHEPPDVILCDLSLPGIDGHEFLRRARKLPGMEGVPALALSGFGEAADIHSSHVSGFFAHLIKPVALDELRENLLRALGAGPSEEPRDEVGEPSHGEVGQAPRNGVGQARRAGVANAPHDGVGEDPYHGVLGDIPHDGAFGENANNGAGANPNDVAGAVRSGAASEIPNDGAAEILNDEAGGEPGGESRTHGADDGAEAAAPKRQRAV